jgi:small GTP-binding protein
MSGQGLKIILIGDSGVGKTSLTNWLKYQRYVPNPENTIGAAYMVHNLNVIHGAKHKNVKLEIWDTAGQERFRSMSKLYYRNTYGCFCVFDLTNFSSFLSASQWIAEFRSVNTDPHIIILVANKSDIDQSKWAVSHAEIEDFCLRENLMCIYTSSLSGANVNQAFETMTLHILDDKSIIIKKHVVSMADNPTVIELASRYAPAVGISKCSCG